MQTKTKKAVSEVACRLGVSVRTGYNLASAGELPVVEINGVKRIPIWALEQWLADHEQQALAAVRKGSP